MAIRILGVEVPEHVHVEHGLRLVKGIGLSTARKICGACNVELGQKMANVSENDLEKIRSYVKEHNIITGSELSRMQVSIIKNLIAIKCYRGRRHVLNLPVRGQRTSSNSRTARRKNR